MSVDGDAIGALRYARGAVAIVTGAASGIGRALADALAARGVDVTLADLQAGPVEEAAAAVRAAGGEARAVVLDVRDGEAFDALVDETIARAGRLDLLFNNAGVGIAGDSTRLERDHWRHLVDVNLLGVANGIDAAYGRMIAQGFGHIVNTASIAGLVPMPGAAAYGATKYGVVGLSRALRTEAAAHGVRVTAICPGAVRTPILNGGVFGAMLDGLTDEARSRAVEKLRPLDPAEFASRALRAVERNAAVAVVPGWWRALWWLDRFAPLLGETVVGWIYRGWMRRAEREQAEPTRRR